jgi:predicted glutamine amidotransferase
MCRWLAYAGPSIHLDSLLLRPENSLIKQSLDAHESISAVNADGFGIGWYGGRGHPGVFKDVLPAWNDSNLRNLTEQIRSNLFFGHVRAATGTAVNRTNCHPFRYGKWLFMHNGAIGGFNAVRRDLAFAVAPELFPHILGTTDSEIFFYLLLTHGLEDDPEAALRHTIRRVEAAQAAAGVTERFAMTVAISDGERIIALRHASEGRPPSLYYAIGAKPEDGDGDVTVDTDTATIILSEPLDDDLSQWTRVEPDHLVLAGAGGISVSAFTV